jgi:hypothetical protein
MPISKYSNGLQDHAHAQVADAERGNYCGVRGCCKRASWHGDARHRQFASRISRSAGRQVPLAALRATRSSRIASALQVIAHAEEFELLGIGEPVEVEVVQRCARLIA